MTYINERRMPTFLCVTKAWESESIWEETRNSPSHVLLPRCSVCVALRFTDQSTHLISGQASKGCRRIDILLTLPLGKWNLPTGRTVLWQAETASWVLGCREWGRELPEACGVKKSNDYFTLKKGAQGRFNMGFGFVGLFDSVDSVSQTWRFES